MRIEDNEIKDRIQIAEELFARTGESSRRMKKTSARTAANLEKPLEYSLSQNYPNPFNPVTTIKYELEKDGLVTIKVYDILGREIRTLVNEEKLSGRYSAAFNASTLPSGTYFYELRAGDYSAVKKLILLK